MFFLIFVNRTTMDGLINANTQLLVVLETKIQNYPILVSVVINHTKIVTNNIINNTM